ncbi:4813_t:CDS:2, partial [Gigaspora rosea]
ETTKKVASDIYLDSYKYISKPQCFKNAISEALVYFFDLTNPLATETAQNIPISDAINNYFGITYPTLYIKMKKLNLGPNIPKSFGIFPM